MISTDRRQLANDLETSLTVALNGRQATIWTALPAFITKVTFSEMTIECQPTIQGEVELPDGTVQNVNLPKLVDVPICFPSGGGFLITLPLKVDDEVLVIIASRCIDSWWQSSGIQTAAEFRMHDLSDGFAIPGPRSLPKVASGISTTGAQIRNDAGTTYVEIAADGKIKLVTPSTVALTGNLTVSGTIVATGEVTGNGIALSTHEHPVTTAPGTTGAPI